MIAEHLLFIGYFALVSAGFLLVRWYAISVTSLYDIAKRNDSAGTAYSGQCLLVRLTLAVVLPSLIAVVASATGPVVHQVLEWNGLDAPIEIVPTGVWLRFAEFGNITRPPSAIATVSVVLLGVASIFLRNSVAFVFLALHAALAFMSIVVDHLFAAPIPDRASVTAWVLNLTFYLILVSQFFFAFLMAGTFRQLLFGSLSAALSGATFAIGATVLAVLATVVDETSYMLVVYLVIAYGIVAYHVAALSMSLSNR